METIIIDAKVIEEHKKEAARRERRAKWNKFKEETVTFVENHWQELAALAVPAAVGVAKGISKYAKKQQAVRAELKTKDLRVDDTSLGHYWELRRKLTNREWIQIEARRQRGERLANILADMKVLK